jgi:hypothetical protein
MIALTCKRQNDFVEMTLLIENPFRDDSAVQAKSGKVSYRNFIQELIITCNERVLLTAQFNPAMATHPTLMCRAKHLLKNDTVKVEWLDNLGKSAVETFRVTV